MHCRVGLQSRFGDSGWQRTKAGLRRGALGVSLLSLSVGSALSADMGEDGTTPVPLEPDWVLQVTPYMWAAGMKGNISPFRRAPTIEVEKSFSDVMDDLNFGGFINVWARRDRFVFSADAMYVNLTESHVIGALPVIGPVPPIGADVDTAQFSATLQAGYRVYEAPDFTFDVLGGVRLWYLWNDVNVTFAGQSRSVSSEFGWVDPIVGARAFYRVNEKVSLMAQADIGGFGAGSDFTWQAMATVNYSFNDKLSISAGYKALSVDYDSDGHVFDTTLAGPVLGFTYRF
ncbi:outer membrane protein [Nitratireductor indicus]|nr:hypothetical protein SAMN05216176_112144 [Nitratireductor indicus]